MPKRNLIWVVVVFAFFVLCVKADNPARQTQRDYYEDFEKLAIILRHVTQRYVSDVDADALFEGMARGMLTQLDPYCTYIPPRLQDDFEKDVHGRFGGIGIRIGLRNNMLTVISPLEGTPAFRAGVMSGDAIIKIEGESTEGITLTEAVERLTGEPGTKVTITVVHEGEAVPVDITITRARIIVPTVAGYRRANGGHWDYVVDARSGIGYIRLISFTDDTLAALDGAMKELTTQKMRGLILDLRFNPGGKLSTAVQVADRFIEAGVIVTTRGRSGRKLDEYEAAAAGTYPDFPVVVLVNRYSASAAEIVAGAVQHHHRAVVLGERTFGKGSVQSVIELGDGRGSLKLTTAEYYLPGGRSINRQQRTGRAVKRPEVKRTPGTSVEPTWGVEPDIEVVLTDKENARLLSLRREADVIPHEGPSTRPSTAPAAPTTAPAPPFVDRQLERAIDVLKAYKVWQQRASRTTRARSERVRADAPPDLERALTP